VLSKKKDGLKIGLHPTKGQYFCCNICSSWKRHYFSDVRGVNFKANMAIHFDSERHREGIKQSRINGFFKKGAAPLVPSDFTMPAWASMSQGYHRLTHIQREVFDQLPYKSHQAFSISSVHRKLELIDPSKQPDFETIVIERSFHTMLTTTSRSRASHLLPRGVNMTFLIAIRAPMLMRGDWWPTYRGI